MIGWMDLMDFSDYMPYAHVLEFLIDDWALGLLYKLYWVLYGIIYVCYI